MSWNDNPPKDVLTDKQIEQYILEGRYGEERKAALLEQRWKRRRKRIFSDARLLLRKLMSK